MNLLEYSENLAKSRRNLVVISSFVLLVVYVGVKVKELSILGMKLEISRPDSMKIVLLLLLFWYLYRYINLLLIDFSVSKIKTILVNANKQNKKANTLEIEMEGRFSIFKEMALKVSHYEEVLPDENKPMSPEEKELEDAEYIGAQQDHEMNLFAFESTKGDILQSAKELGLYTARGEISVLSVPLKVSYLFTELLMPIGFGLTAMILVCLSDFRIFDLK